jgi:hypothetical protein
VVQEIWRGRTLGRRHQLKLECSKGIRSWDVEELLYLRKGRKTANMPTATVPPSMSRMSENVGGSTSRTPKGLYGQYRDNFTLPYISISAWFILYSFSSMSFTFKYVCIYIIFFKTLKMIFSHFILMCYVHK